MGMLSWGSLLVAFRPAWASGSRGSWLNSQVPGPHLLRVWVWQGKLPFNQRSAPRGCQGPGSTQSAGLALPGAWP